ADFRGRFFVESPESICIVLIYVPMAEQNYLNGMQTLFHEYAHYFMSQHRPLYYPPWYSEGSAEFFAATLVRADSVEIGGRAEYRIPGLLKSSWVPLRNVLFPSNSSLGPNDINNFYGESWLLIHYLSMDEGRSKQLDAYLEALNSGVEPELAFHNA